MSVEITATHRVHGGTLRYCRHDSAATRKGDEQGRPNRAEGKEEDPAHTSGVA